MLCLFRQQRNPSFSRDTSLSSRQTWRTEHTYTETSVVLLGVLTISLEHSASEARRTANITLLAYYGVVSTPMLVSTTFTDVKLDGNLGTGRRGCFCVFFD